MKQNNAEIILQVISHLPPPIKLKVQLGYNHLLYELKKVIAEHGPIAILGLEYLSEQIRNIEKLEPENIMNLSLEPLETL